VDAAGSSSAYVDAVSRYRAFVVGRGLDALVVVLALAAVVGTAVRTDHYRPAARQLGL